MKKVLSLSTVIAIMIACTGKNAKITDIVSNKNDPGRSSLIQAYNNIFPKLEEVSERYTALFDIKKGPQGTESNLENEVNFLNLEPDFSINEKINNFKKVAGNDALSKAGLT